MRILSFNVNGIRAVEKRGFVDWIRQESPDVLCLQETKAHPDQLSSELNKPVDKDGKAYFSYWASAQKKGYSGVAIYSRIEPRDIKPLGVPEFDAEGRVLQADFKDFVLISAYFPNSQDAGARLGYKLDFCAAMLECCNKLVSAGRHLVLCGDYNIAHTPIDLARPKENEGNAGYLPEERAWMDTFIAAGYVDTFRSFHPGETGCYSWWSYRMSARERNVGWRLDYHCVDKAFMPKVSASIIRPDVQGSDHCPVQIELKLK
ncbi:exodeoxyribonuclease III [Treponema primitia ZAS-2]|uniref:Exodeoxyribonuclease III n=1 Tax=Treponema primitia (strain ATCC BAA-887 / DSM 12427 / ZAS-2) TaxID=545694 RepID=F5YPX9_TREPZ|nr:exodeoxyribonuclease III [Treponema primitia ZAS-2]